MAGGPVDGSLRRAILSDEAAGSTIPDSRKKLDDTPIAIMEPGTEDLALQFTDQKGLTDDYGNIYQGYGGSGGSSISVSHTPPSSLDEEIDDANDGDVLVYDAADEKWLPNSFEAAGIPRASKTDMPSEGEILVYDDVAGEYNPKALTELPIAVTDGTTPNQGEILVYDSGPDVWRPTPIEDTGIVIIDDNPDDGDFLVWSDAEGKFVPAPQTFTDFICVVIETPINKVYTITMGLPYPILITDVDSSIEAGPYSISGEPSGPISAGTALSFTIGSTDATSSFLRVQIEFTRSLGIVA